MSEFDNMITLGVFEYKLKNPSATLDQLNDFEKILTKKLKKSFDNRLFHKLHKDERKEKRNDKPEVICTNCDYKTKYTSNMKSHVQRKHRED